MLDRKGELLIYSAAIAAPYAWTALLAGVRLLPVLMWSPGLGAPCLPMRMRLALAGLLGAAATAAGPRAALPADVATAGAWLAAELALGMAVGFGLLVIGAGLQLAGDLLDMQLGWTDGAAAPGTGPSQEPLAPAARTFAWLGLLAVFFAPWSTSGGGLPGVLLDVFRLQPPGSLATAPFTTWIAAPLEISAELAVRVLAPVLSVLAIVAWAQALMSRIAPKFCTGTVAATVRPLLGLLVLSATFSGAAEHMTGALSSWARVLAAADR